MIREAHLMSGIVLGEWHAIHCDDFELLDLQVAGPDSGPQKRSQDARTAARRGKFNPRPHGTVYRKDFFGSFGALRHNRRN